MPSVLDALVETVIGQGEPLTASRRLKVMMLTVGLEVGGTENQALELSSRLDRRRFYVTVCALKGEGAIASELRDRGIKVVALSGKGKWDVRVPFRLWRVLRAERPDIIHAFLFLSRHLPPNAPYVVDVVSGGWFLRVVPLDLGARPCRFDRHASQIAIAHRSTMFSPSVMGRPDG